MAIRVAWDRTPVSVHGTKDELESLIYHLRENHGFRKHSIIMPDRDCLLYTSPSPRDLSTSRMPSSA